VQHAIFILLTCPAGELEIARQRAAEAVNTQQHAWLQLEELRTHVLGTKDLSNRVILSPRRRTRLEGVTVSDAHGP
jgi:hypothetical protein